MVNGIDLERSIDLIKEGLNGFTRAVADPSSVTLEEIQPHMEGLLKALDVRTGILVAFAWLAVRDDAGRQVHSHRPLDYFTKHLGMSYAEAKGLIEAAEKLYGPAPEEDSKTEAAAGEEEQLDLGPTEDETPRKKARRKLTEGQPVPPRTLEMINREIEFLNDQAPVSRAELLARAIDEAARRSYSSLRLWLRDEIRRANARTADPHAATRKRDLWFSEQDANGGVRIGGYIDAPTAALLAKALAPASRPGAPGIPEDEDTRTLGQRRADVLATMLQNYLNSKEAHRRGAGSIVIAATLEDFETLTPATRFLTDTGHLLTPLDIARLGAATSDYICVVDEDWQPLALGRGQRTASLAQYIALVATQLCCTHEDCSRAAVESDVHHLIAWSHGGPTDINNLALLCRGHHSANNDARDGSGNMGHMEYCPDSGRVGFRAPGAEELIFNDSPFFRYSTLAKFLRRRPPNLREAA